MKIAIIGAGFTGLSAGLELVRRGHQVHIFDKDSSVGGLATGFREKNWDWTIEKFYHHIFTNDTNAINLAHELKIEPLFFHPNTSVYWQKQIYPFNSATDLLRFPSLNLIDKLRMGTVIAAFKALPNGRFLEFLTARTSLTSLMGSRGFSTIWEPLLVGKFHHYAPQVNLAWFWARIKKRTTHLGTFPGGFQGLAERLAAEVIRLGGKISLNSPISLNSLTPRFDAVLSTSPAVAHDKNASSPSYLNSQILLIEMNQPFLKNIYWLNILDRTFPFLVTAEHTNFVSKKHFNNTHLLYIGNYLPSGHPLMSLDSHELFQKFLPYLKKINPQFSEKQVIKKNLFTAPFAQPVVTVNYSQTIPQIKQTDNFYLATQSMIYPWDRGINYAIELGQKAAQEILK